MAAFPDFVLCVLLDSDGALRGMAGDVVRRAFHLLHLEPTEPGGDLERVGSGGGSPPSGPLLVQPLEPGGSWRRRVGLAGAGDRGLLGPEPVRFLLRQAAHRCPARGGRHVVAVRDRHAAFAPRCTALSTGTGLRGPSAVVLAAQRGGPTPEHCPAGSGVESVRGHHDPLLRGFLGACDCARRVCPNPAAREG